jgi:hypothetical protein
MFLLSLVDTLTRTIGSLLILVVGYLALLLCVIVGIVIADLIHKSAHFTWSQFVAPRDSAGIAPAKSAGAARNHFLQHNFLNHRFVLVRKSSL